MWIHGVGGRSMNRWGLSRRSWIAGGCAAIAGARLPSASGESAGPQLCGQIGTTHPHADGKFAAMLARPAEWRVVGWVEEDERQRATAAGRKPYAAVPAMTEQELLGTPGLAAVTVETEPAAATATALRVLQAGKHVHLDKPGGVEHAAFATMRRLAEASGLTVQMGYMLRYNPAFELLFRAVREGWLGAITEIDASMGKLADVGTRRQIVVQPGGAMFEIGCHLIDVVVTLLGRPSRVETFSTPSAEDGVMDNQLAVLVYPGATAVVRANFVDPFGGPRRRFNVTGTLGSFEILPLESGRVQLSLQRESGGYARGTQNLQLELPGGRYDGEFADLAGVVRGEKRLSWDAAHDIAVHETALRASGIWEAGS